MGRPFVWPDENLWGGKSLICLDVLRSTSQSFKWLLIQKGAPSPSGNLHAQAHNNFDWTECSRQSGALVKGNQITSGSHKKTKNKNKSREALRRFPYRKHGKLITKDLMQSLKQNAPIKYIINCFQIWNRHVFIKRNNKNHTSHGRCGSACGVTLHF